MYLNFSPDLLKVTDVLKVLKEYIPIEAGIIMIPPDGSKQAIHDEFYEILGQDISLQTKKELSFIKK